MVDEVDQVTAGLRSSRQGGISAIGAAGTIEGRYFFHLEIVFLKMNWFDVSAGGEWLCPEKEGKTDSTAIDSTDEAWTSLKTQM